jgi:hypothetical protein
MKSKTKRVFVLEIDEESPEYHVLYGLVHLGREDMKKLGFTEKDYRASSNIQAEILKRKRK